MQPLYRRHKIYAGKPGLPGLPATFGSEEECETLEIVLADEVLDLTVTLYYTAFYDVDVITRSVRRDEPCQRTGVSYEGIFSGAGS